MCQAVDGDMAQQQSESRQEGAAKQSNDFYLYIYKVTHGWH